MSNQVPSFFESVQRNFDKAAKHTGLPKGLLEQIKVCNAVYLSLIHISEPTRPY